MIDKYNITIENKETKIIYYTLNLDLNYWYKSEYDDESNQISFETKDGYWYIDEYNSRGK